MPRGIPAAGKRKPGGGRKLKYGENTTQVRVPLSIASKIDELLCFLTELDDEIAQWEAEIQSKDLKTNPRYSKAAILAASIREKINALKADTTE
ncbi:hypothetical protein [Nostoc sp. FACHB-190]|uniref:hypothetical protein n=1 Tax=Nostoc sp. FACHB-190 TaxID=2692838 RepID=UPI001686E0B8|nr:hypothetical protein [Nostoc sp. FACHB-190]MBD2298744.1 hypothetical protein [Nostoc sp. FACHB-190]